MAHVEHVLAVVPVSDIGASREWYSRLFGRGPDNSPMENLVEWRVTDSAWVQVTEDPARAGSAMLNLAISDLDEGIRELGELGIETGDVVEANRGVRLCPLADPDGTAIQLVGGFRVVY